MWKGNERTWGMEEEVEGREMEEKSRESGKRGRRRRKNNDGRNERKRKSESWGGKRQNIYIMNNDKNDCNSLITNYDEYELVKYEPKQIWMIKN